jgi:hypothetical protein
MPYNHIWCWNMDPTSNRFTLCGWEEDYSENIWTYIYIRKLENKNKETDGLIGHEDIVTFTKSLRIRWLGHVERMNNNRMPKIILNAKMEVRRRKDVQGSNCLTTSNVTLKV